MSANTGLTHEKETQMRWEQPHEERGRHRQNYLHYGHGAVLGPVRPQEPPGSARPSPAGAPPAAALSAQHSRLPSIPPSVPPSFCLPTRASQLWPSLPLPFRRRGAAGSSCHATLGSLALVRAVADPSLPPAAGRSRLLGAGVQFAEESRCHGAAAQESRAVLRSQQSLLPRPASPGATGTSPAASQFCLSWD